MIRIVSLAALALTAAPTLAQTTAAVPATADALPDPYDQSDQLMIGVGGAFIPDYTGSDNYRFTPAAAARGRYHGISFVTLGPQLEVNLIPRGHDRLVLSAGPVAALGFNRTRKVKDPVVALLPKRKTAIELGGFVGASLDGLTNPYDSLAAKVTVTHDVANAHRSTIVSPGLSFSTPLSRSTFVGLSGGLDFVSSRYAQYYFGVTPVEAAMSKLPAFSPGGGLKDWNVNLLALQSLNGNLLHGLSIGGTVGYSRLQGDFKRSPLIAQRGKAGQWLAALGLGYSF